MSHAPPQWDSRFPDRDQLRAEARCLTACVRDQLLTLIPDGEIRGLYLTGSTVKSWESPLDYVPEVSDVDIHVSFRDDTTWRKYLDTVPKALEVQAGIEACFESRVKRPIHHPRLQLIVMNKLMGELEGFMYSPRSTVVVLHGEAYSRADYSDPDTIRRHNSADLVERAGFVERVPLFAIDRHWVHAREILGQLVWRVSPVGPLVLHISGLDTEHAWSLNRTRATAALLDLGLDNLADSYAAFYMSGWDYFLSGFTDTNACRAAILAATRVLTKGAEHGQQWLDANPGTRDPTPKRCQPGQDTQASALELPTSPHPDCSAIPP